MSLLRKIAMGLLASGLALHGQAQGDYVEEILAGSRKRLTRVEFHAIETKAFQDFGNPASYEALSDLFQDTTEAVWSAIYAETYCQLAPASSMTTAMGSRIATLLSKALSTTPDGFAISLSKSSEVAEDRLRKGQLPFENNYEVSLLLAIIKSGVNCLPLNLEHLTRIRQAQVEILAEKLGPGNALIDRLVSIYKVGHFEAYNYWLFQGAFPAEFQAWKASHEKGYGDWLGWQKTHPILLSSNAFHRLAEALSEWSAAEASRKGPGFGPWRFGLSKAEVASFAPFGPYKDVASTGGLETAHGEFEARRTNISFLFDEGGLAKIQIWAYEGKDEEAALEAWTRVYRHLRQGYGPVEARTLGGAQEVTERALLDGVRTLWASTPASEMAKLQMAPTAMPADKNVFASIFRHPTHGYFVFLYLLKA